MKIEPLRTAVGKAYGPAAREGDLGGLLLRGSHVLAGGNDRRAVIVRVRDRRRTGWGAQVFLWQSLASRPPPPQCFTLGAQVFTTTGLQRTTGGGGGTGLGQTATTGVQETGATQAHRFLWQASAFPAITSVPRTPVKTKVDRCLIINASP